MFKAADSNEQATLNRLLIEYNSQISPISLSEQNDDETDNSCTDLCLLAGAAGAFLGTSLVVVPNITGFSTLVNFLLGYTTGSLSVAVGSGCYHAHNDLQTHMERQQTDQGVTRLNNPLRMSENIQPH